MLDKTYKPIHLLPEQLANQIAAGEVVERPASVIKELVENSLDAGATQIEIDIIQGGTRLIKVMDNGCGISKTDLPLALSRHATSKIATLDDLLHIASLGFRGEALASIAAVSNLILTSQVTQQDHAWVLQCHGVVEKPELTPAAHPIGTTIEVQDLFQNTPARRKFLRADKTEFMHIDSILRRLAMSRFDVGFVLRHNQREIFRLPAINNSNEKSRRVARLWGKNFLQNALEIDFTTAGLHLSGWISLASFSRSQTDLQYFYLNGRTVRDRLITHAIREPYQDLMYHGRHPAYLLFLEIDPSCVDVNVHPTKQEVRFRESRLIHDFISHSLQQALNDKLNPTALTSSTVTQTTNQSSFNQYTATANPKIALQAYANATHHHNTQIHDRDEQTQLPLGKALAQLHQHYILAQNTQGLLLIDIPAACIFRDSLRLNSAFKERNITTQPLLIPMSLSITQQQITALESHTDLLQRLGLDISTIGPNTILIRQVPTMFRHADIANFVNTLLNELSKHTHIEPDTLQMLLNTLTQLGQPEKQKELSIDEMNALLRDFESIPPDELSAQHGLWAELDLSAIKKIIAHKL